MNNVLFPKDPLNSVELRRGVDFHDDCHCPEGAEDKCIDILCPRKAVTKVELTEFEAEELYKHVLETMMHWPDPQISREQAAVERAVRKLGIALSVKE